jgi:hypothetical protein
MASTVFKSEPVLQMACVKDLEDPLTDVGQLETLELLGYPIHEVPRLHAFLEGHSPDNITLGAVLNIMVSAFEDPKSSHMNRALEAFIRKTRKIEDPNASKESNEIVGMSVLDSTTLKETSQQRPRTGASAVLQRARSETFSYRDSITSVVNQGEECNVTNSFLEQSGWHQQDGHSEASTASGFRLGIAAPIFGKKRITAKLPGVASPRKLVDEDSTTSPRGTRLLEEISSSSSHSGQQQQSRPATSAVSRSSLPQLSPTGMAATMPSIAALASTSGPESFRKGRVGGIGPIRGQPSLTSAVSTGRSAASENSKPLGLGVAKGATLDPIGTARVVASASARDGQPHLGRGHDNSTLLG